MEVLNDKKLDSIYQTINKEKKQMNTSLKDLFKNAEPVNAFLEFTNEESLYKVENKLHNDAKSKLNLNRIFAGVDNKYYKNTKTKESFYESSISGELLLIELKPKKWQITQTSKKIGNHLCYKAIDIESDNKKIKPIVWFTPSIPVSFGPKEYSGLPGLVLEVELFNSKIIATKIILNPKTKIEIKKPVKGEHITSEKYYKMMMNYKKRV